jgi:hypothetical protein
MSALGFNSVVKMNVVSLMMRETGTYNAQHLRPYHTTMDSSVVNILTDRLMKSGDKQITGSMLSGISGCFIEPQAAPESQANIINGWDERRIRFVLKLRCETQVGAVTMYYIQGYTSYTGISLQSHLVAPDMTFFINSIVQTRITNIQTPMGIQAMETVFENSHVLADNNYTNLRGPAIKRLMRPEDVFVNLQTKSLPGMFDSNIVIDDRTALLGEAVKSRRNNGIGSNYAAKIIDAYGKATDLLEFGENQKNILKNARGNVIELSAATDPFLARLTAMSNSAVGNKFTYGELRSIDPNIDNVTNYEVTGPTQLASMHNAGSTTQWHGSDRLTQAATILSQSVPALMMELFISNLYLESSNYDVTGAMNTKLVTAKGLTNADMTQNYNMFIHRFEHELMNNLTYGNSVSYALKLRVDLMGDTWISISLDGGAAYDYVTPSFCDNLMAPIVTTNPNTVGLLISDFETLTETIREAVGTSMGHGVTSASQINTNY